MKLIQKYKRTVLKHIIYLGSLYSTSKLSDYSDEKLIVFVFSTAYNINHKIQYFFYSEC